MLATSKEAIKITNQELRQLLNKFYLRLNKHYSAISKAISKGYTIVNIRNQQLSTRRAKALKHLDKN